MIAAIAVAATGFASGFAIQAATDDSGFLSGVAAVWDCPSGQTVGSYRHGSRVYATGRDQSGDWIEVRDVTSPSLTVWVPAGDVQLDEAADGLPIVDCEPTDGPLQVTDLTTTTTIAPGTTTTTAPGSTTTTEQGSTSTTSSSTTSSSSTTTPPTTTTSTTSSSSTTTPPTTTTSTTAPDSTAPQISNPVALPGEIWEEDGNSISCPPNTSREAEVSAVVTDSVGVTTVTASWSIGGSPTMTPMSKNGNTYSATFGPFEADTVPYSPLNPLEVPITIEAGDAAGNFNKTIVTVIVHNIGECFG